jgi:hypothetical protein
MKVTTYHNFHTPVEDREFLDLIEEVKGEKIESQIKAIRYAFHQGNDSLGEKLKKELPAFTPSGVFVGGRTLDYLKDYTGLAHVDIDDLLPEEVEDMRKLVNDCQYTFASFVSPSGLGLKIFIRIASGSEDHKTAIQQLMDFYAELTGVPCDPKCKDITRLCFMSWDENAYTNEQSDIFTPLVVEKETVENVPSEHTPKSIEYCVSFTEKVSTYAEGNRNSHVYLIARNANRFGIEQQEILDYCLNTFDLSQQEIRASVNSAYKHNSAEFAKFANLAKSATNEESSEGGHDLLYNTPKIPDWVFDGLPDILREGTEAFPVERERDVFMTSAITILSGCLPEVSGLYNQRTVYPNLFCFILAPPASGKGSMQSSKELADKYHRALLDESKTARKAYEQELRDYKKNHSATNKQSDPNVEPPEEPPFKVVYIPANTSSAQLYVHLQNNDEKGIICETEADTLGTVFKNEWGSYSDLLRKGFHHEKVSLSRKTNKEFIDINHPRLSVALTGTPNQIFNIIPNAEDGLFSRFIFYAFRADTGWVSPAPDPTRVNLTEHFDKLGDRVLEMVEFLQANPTVVELSKVQWDMMNNFFSEHLEDITQLVGEEATSVVKRMGLIFYRMCMIFTAMRKFEDGDCSEVLTATDEDVQIALVLTETFLQHSILIFSNLPGQDATYSVKNPPKKQKFLEALPDCFTRKEAVDIGKKAGFATRTVDYCLKKWEGVYIRKEDTGWYVKG